MRCMGGDRLTGCRASSSVHSVRRVWGRCVNDVFTGGCNGRNDFAGRTRGLPGGGAGGEWFPTCGIGGQWGLTHDTGGG